MILGVQGEQLGVERDDDVRLLHTLVDDPLQEGPELRQLTIFARIPCLLAKLRALQGVVAVRLAIERQRVGVQRFQHLDEV